MSLPRHDSREAHAAAVLAGRFGLEVEPVTRPTGITLYCYDPANPIPLDGDPAVYDTPPGHPGINPTAIVVRVREPQGGPGWGVIAAGKLQRKILAALNTGGI